MNLSQTAVVIILFVCIFAYAMEEFPEAKNAIKKTLGCFSGVQGPFSSPICAVIDFTGLAVIGKGLSRAVQEGSKAVQGVRSLARGGTFKEGVKAAEEAATLRRETQVAEEAAQAAREATLAEEAARAARYIRI